MPGIYSQIEDLSKLKGIDPAIVMEAVRDAILVAARKYYKSKEDLVSEVNLETGNVEVFAVKTVTDLVADSSKEISINEAKKINKDARVGDTLRFQKPTDALGRISAQMAKQVIFQKIREAERDRICEEFQDRLDNLETCTIKRNEGPDLIVDLGRTEARLPRREQSRLESFSIGDRVRVIIKQIERVGRGPAVVVSRASEELVKRLFEQEVPEIYDGTVQIQACAREAGERTKVAVISNDRDVDPVGACVGMKGMRVQSIIRELRGEKIDIIQYSEDPVELAARALSPARISRVQVVDPVSRHLEVVVDETQLSLAIGKKGQNVRLAAKLLGWKIDIKSEEDKRLEMEDAMAALSGSATPVSVLIDFGLPEDLADKLIEAGSATVEALADMTPEMLQQVEGMNASVLEQIQLAVNGYYGQFEPQQPYAVEPGEAGYSEAEAAQAAAAVPAGAFVMPGLPEEGAGGDEEDDDEIPFEDFDTMKIPRVSSASADSADDDSAYRDKDDSEDDETAAAEARSEDSD
jgi:N utilization substance protein A